MPRRLLPIVLFACASLVRAEEIVQLPVALSAFDQELLHAGLSPGARHLLLPTIREDGRWAWWFDGELIGAWDELPNSGFVTALMRGYDYTERIRFFGGRWPVWSADDERWAAAARRGERWVMVVDGVEQPGCEDAAWPVFSPDSTRIAWADHRGEQSVVVVDGRAWPGDGGPDPVVFSADSRHVAWLRSLPGPERLRVAVIDGVEGRPFAEISGLALSPDGSHHAFCCWRAQDERTQVVIDGRPGPVHEIVEGLLYAPDGRLAFVGTDGDHARLFLDGQPGPAFEQITLSGDCFSADGAHVAYRGYRARGDETVEFVVLDGVEHGPYEEVGSGELSVRFAPTGARVGWAAQDAEGWRMVIDGVAGPRFDGLWAHSLTFSADGRHVAYVGSRGEDDFVVCDGVESRAWASVDPQSLVFADDGRLAYAATEPGTLAAVVVAGEQTVRDAIFPYFLPDGALAWIRVSQGDFGPEECVVLNGHAGRDFGGIIRTGSGFASINAEGSLRCYAWDSPLEDPTLLYVYRLTLTP